MTVTEERTDYRSDLAPGDIVRGKYGNLARLVAWNGSWSHLTGGRIAVLEPLAAYPGVPMPEGAHPYAHASMWECSLSRAVPGDIGAHARRYGNCGMWQHYPCSWA